MNESDWKLTAMALPVLAVAVGLVLVGRRFIRCGLGGVCAMAGLTLIGVAFSTRMIGAFGEGEVFRTVRREFGPAARTRLVAVHDWTQAVGTGVGGGLLMAGVMAGRQRQT